MKKLLFMLILSLFALNAQADKIFEKNIAGIARESQIMDFYSCKDYVSQALKNYSAKILEDSSDIYKVKVQTADASLIITCTHTIIGTKH